MLTTLSSAKAIRAIVRQNLRRYWPVSLVFFLLLFCTNILPSIVMKEWYSLNMIVGGTSPMFVMTEVALPIIVACLVFRYMHTSSGATLMHAFPVSRRTLFKGSLYSAIFLVFSPIILAALTILPFCKTGSKSGDTSFYYFSDPPYLTDWLIFFGTTLVVLVFALALTTIAASLAGNGSGLVGIALVLNFVPFFIALVVAGYLDTFLIGFNDNSSAQMDAFVYLNPMFYRGTVLSDFTEQATYAVSPVIVFLIFIAVAIAVFFAALQLYKRKRLERAGSPISFNFAEIVVTDIITLVSMAGMGAVFYFMVEYYSNYIIAITSFFIGCAIGAVLSFGITTMLVQKTVRIFTRKTLKGLGIFAIVGAVFIAFTVFDLTGYTDRIPDTSRIKTAELSLSRYPFPYPYIEAYSYGIQKSVLVEAKTKDEFTIITDIHRGLIEGEKDYKYRNKDILDLDWSQPYGEQEPESNDDSWRGRASMTYELKGIANQYRTYSMRSGYASDDTRETLAAMDAFREGASIEKMIGYDSVNRISIDNEAFSEDSQNDTEFMVTGFSGARTVDDRVPYDDEQYYDLNLLPAERRELLECMDEDFKALSIWEMAMAAPYEIDIVTVLELEIRSKNDYNDDYSTRYLEYAVSSSYTKTLAWLKRRL